MEFTYFSGALVAALICVYQIGSIIFAHYSVFASNLKTIGLRLHWASLAPQVATEPAPHFIVKVLMFVLEAAIGIIFSWLTVASFTIRMLSRFMEVLRMPDSIKEASWRLRNDRLAFKEAAKHWATIRGVEDADRESIYAQLKEMAERVKEKDFADNHDETTKYLIRQQNKF